jgi:CheY-like chemotaxis protein
VLVVEDEARMAGLLKRALQEEGHAVDVAADGLGGAVRLVRSALRTFGAELERHAGSRCSGGLACVLPVPSGAVLPVPPGGGR